MSVTKRILFGAGASWFSRIMTIVLGLVLMPVLFARLGKEDIGLWMLLGQTWMLMGILDLGFSPTITRRIALAKGKSGSAPDAPLTEDSQREVAVLVATGMRFFRWLSLAVFLIGFLAGCLFLSRMELTTLTPATAFIAWAILCLAQALGVWASVWTSLLRGVGYVGWDSIISSFVTAAVLAAQISALMLGGGLVALASVAAIGALVQRYLVLGFARHKRPDLFVIRGEYDASVLRAMWPAAIRTWVTSLGTVIIMSSDQYFIAAMGSVKEIPAFRAAYLLVYNLSSMATIMAGASAVFVSHLWQSGEKNEIHRVVIRNLRFGLGIMAAGGACILVLGPRLFDLWLGAGSFIGYPCLILFFAMLFTDAQSYIVSTCSRATEDEAFAVCSVIGGVLKIGFAWLLGHHYGLVGIAASTLIAQWLTNHWYMIHRGFHRLEIRYTTYMFKVVVPLSILFLCVYAVTDLLVRAPAFGSGIPALTAASGTAGLFLLGYCWIVVLDTSERNRLSLLIKSRGARSFT
ncbi:MAG: oligosaccharide flippase family protein [Verrucomicrobiota bacterium]